MDIMALLQTSSGEVSAAGSPSGTPTANQVPKYGTLIPNRIFVGGIAANVSMPSFMSLYRSHRTDNLIAIVIHVERTFNVIFRNLLNDL